MGLFLIIFRMCCGRTSLFVVHSQIFLARACTSTDAITIHFVVQIPFFGGLIKISISLIHRDFLLTSRVVL